MVKFKDDKGHTIYRDGIEADALKLECPYCKKIKIFQKQNKEGI